jgi:hypothetical protein
MYFNLQKKSTHLRPRPLRAEAGLAARPPAMVAALLLDFWLREWRCGAVWRRNDMMHRIAPS